MSSFSFLIVCLQACLAQMVFSQNCGCGFSSGGYPALASLNLNNALNLAQSQQSCPPIKASLAPLNQVSAASAGNYGGVGTGNVGVNGEIGVAGNTVVVGSVPVLGIVDFSGSVPASGSVSISGQCGCGCQ